MSLHNSENSDQHLADIALEAPAIDLSWIDLEEFQTDRETCIQNRIRAILLLFAFLAVFLWACHCEPGPKMLKFQAFLFITALVLVGVVIGLIIGG